MGDGTAAAARTALVTGATSGIGLAFARRFSADGCRLVLVARDAARLGEVAEELRGRHGTDSEILPADLCDREQLDRVAARLRDGTPPVDILVNNAGIAFLEPFHKVSQKTWDLTMNVNVKGPFFLAQQVALSMIQRGAGGRIINISSTNGLQGEAHLAPYNASKGALEMLTKSLAIDLSPYNITVNSVAPGLIETEIGDDFEVAEGFWAYLMEHIPLQRMGKPEDCVGAVVMLAGEAGAYITGQTIVVDGGILCEQIPRLKFGMPE